MLLCCGRLEADENVGFGRKRRNWINCHVYVGPGSYVRTRQVQQFHKGEREAGGCEPSRAKHRCFRVEFLNFWEETQARQRKPACTGGCNSWRHVHRGACEAYSAKGHDCNPVYRPSAKHTGMFCSLACCVAELHRLHHQAALMSQLQLTSCCSALVSRPSRAARRLSSADEWAVCLTLLCLALVRLSSTSDITAVLSQRSSELP